MRKTFFAFLFFISTAAQAAAPQGYYDYAHNDAEYSIALPELPGVESIWPDSAEIPFNTGAPDDEMIGETAFFKRIDLQTGAPYDVTVYFLKSSYEFLYTLTEEKVKSQLEEKFQTTGVTDAKFTFSQSADGLKWATISGFAMDKDGEPQFNALHYLTGKKSVMVIKAKYNIENETFRNYYKTMIDSVTYHPL